MIKNIATGVLFYSVAVSSGSYFLSTPLFALNVLIGSIIVLLNLAALVFSWKRIFYKKSIALGVFVIIFKYLILGVILWSLSVFGWLNVVGFLAGLASLLFSLLTVILVKYLKAEQK